MSIWWNLLLFISFVHCVWWNQLPSLCYEIISNWSIIEFLLFVYLGEFFHGAIFNFQSHFYCFAPFFVFYVCLHSRKWLWKLPCIACFLSLFHRGNEELWWHMMACLKNLLLCQLHPSYLRLGSNWQWTIQGNLSFLSIPSPCCYMLQSLNQGSLVMCQQAGALNTFLWWRKAFMN